MLRIFRHIRIRLLKPGNSQKLASTGIERYLLYAIGEILLVVIGILIALQINNLNQERIDRIYEIKTLKEIRSALDNDIANFERMLGRLERLNEGVTKMKRHVYQNDVFIDSLYRGPNRWYFLRTGIVYQLNRGPYDALKSTGLDKIGNDSLRNQLIDFYDFRVPRWNSLISHYDANYEEEIERLESFLGESFLEQKGNELKIYSRFPMDLLQYPEFLELLHDLEFRAKAQMNSIRYQCKEMESLINLIQQTIN